MAASSPGRGEDLGPQACDEAADITYLTVGFWRRSAKPAPLSFLVLHSREKFVLLAEEPWSGQQAHSRRLFKIVKQLNAKSPFRTSSCGAGNYLVVGFEIKWEDVCGLNYHNPLCQPGRVVIEAAHVTKRQFLTMKEAQKQSGSSEQGVQDLWPETCSWTVPCHVYKYRTVTFNFEDPSLPGVLQPAINNNERLLKLYESGLPVWAIFLPTYGLYYRPWMRRLTWILFIAVSVFSMACGFYDLYKNVPHVDKVLRKVLGSFFLPSTAIFHWLEDHAQIRLSILLTYLFGESILFVHLLTWLDRAWNVAGRPIVEVMGPPLVVLGSGLEQWGRQLLLLGRSFATAASLAFKTVTGPPLVLLLAGMQAVAQFMLPIWQVMVVVVTGPVSLLYAALRSMQAASSTLWQGARPLGHAARSAATLVRTSSLAATGSGASMADVGQQMGWWWRWMPGEAWELLRISSLKTLRALQTLGKLATQLASDVSKHRLTLSRRIYRTWRRCKRWCYGVIMAIASLPAAVYRWFVSFGAVLRHAPTRLSSSPEAETATNVLVDATDRPILTGMMAADNHSKVE
ncbi:hypothetical protein WJX79_002214 [Trebouxia sp. C0005]